MNVAQCIIYTADKFPHLDGNLTSSRSLSIRPRASQQQQQQQQGGNVAHKNSPGKDKKRNRVERDWSSLTA